MRKVKSRIDKETIEMMEEMIKESIVSEKGYWNFRGNNVGYFINQRRVRNEYRS